jgi:hypothetical protein
MFASEFDQESQPEDLDGYPEDWEDYPPERDPDGDPDGEVTEYMESAEPEFPASSPGYSPSIDYQSENYQPDNYLPDDYRTEDYPSDDFSLDSLPKFLFICTILACLILAAGLSFVTIQFPASSSQPLSQSRNGAGNQPQADAAQPASPDNSDCSVSQRFPASIRRWCGLITQYASKHGLPPDLLAALIWQESGGNPIAYSRSGAVGLMQVMPSDGLAASFQCVNGPCFSTRPSMDELKDPEFNVSYGTRMLAGLVGKTGNLREALKSYGPANVGYYYADKVLGIYQSYSN